LPARKRPKKRFVRQAPKKRRGKVSPARAVHPFQRQCGLPSSLEMPDPLRKEVAARLAMKSCRGGIADELNFGKPVGKQKKRQPAGLLSQA